MYYVFLHYTYLLHVQVVCNVTDNMLKSTTMMAYVDS